MIVVEGPDGGGKSTLIKELQDDFGFDVGERGTDDRTKLWTVTRSDTYRALSLAVNAKNEVEGPLIWDRLFYSELVYPQHTGRKCEFSVTEIAFIRRVIGAMGCPVIVCLPPLETVSANIPKAKQMSGVAEAIDKIWETYQNLFKATPATNLIWYDYTGKSPGGGYVDYERLTHNIEHYLALRTERTT